MPALARLVSPGAVVALGLVLISATPALAQTATPPALACGRVAAYTAPTDTAAGSITLGTTTFVVKAGSQTDPPAPIAVGAIVCLDENPAGEILARMILVGDTICGTLQAMTPTSITLRGNRDRIISLRAGTSLSGAQVGTNACFKFGFNAAGDPEIVGFVGPQPTRAPAAPGQLPSTSTDRSGSQDALAVVLVAVLGMGGLSLARLLRTLSR